MLPNDRKDRVTSRCRVLFSFLWRYANHLLSISYYILPVIVTYIAHYMSHVALILLSLLLFSCTVISCCDNYRVSLEYPNTVSTYKNACTFTYAFAERGTTKNSGKGSVNFALRGVRFFFRWRKHAVARTSKWVMSSEECRVYGGGLVHAPLFAHMQIISVIAPRKQKEEQTRRTVQIFFTTLMRQRDNRGLAWRRLSGNLLDKIYLYKKSRAIIVREYSILKSCRSSKCIATGIESITSAKCIKCRRSAFSYKAKR